MRDIHCFSPYHCQIVSYQVRDQNGELRQVRYSEVEKAKVR